MVKRQGGWEIYRRERREVSRQDRDWGGKMEARLLEVIVVVDEVKSKGGQ